MKKRSNVSRPIYWSLITIIICLAFSYGILLKNMISSAISMENNQAKISVLNTEIADLEFEYIKLQNSVTESLASAKGFVAVNPTFIAKTFDGKVSLNKSE